jgi:hypothetical protein
MPSYDSIVVGEDWISEHYFTTDSTKESFQGKVIELRKQWDAETAEGRDTVRRRLLAAAGELQTELSTLGENPDGAPAAHTTIRIVLGFSETLADYTGERAGTELRLPNARPTGVTSTLLLQACPVESVDDLLDPETGLLLDAGEEDGKPIDSVTKAVSAAFRADEPPATVPGRRSARGHRTPRRQARRRTRSGRRDPRAPGPAARRRRKHLVGRCSRRFGQTHRRGVQGSA